MAIAVGGRGATIRRVRRLHGGVDSSTHAVELDSGGWVVLKRTWTTNPRSVSSEFEVLAFAQRVPVPTPEPIALDAAGTWFGQPAFVMTRVRGRSHLHGGRSGPWLRDLALALAAVHSTDVSGAVPGVLRRPHAWQVWQPAPVDELPRSRPVEAILAAAVSLQEDLQARPPATSLVHHDFHTGNVAWYRGRVSAVLDWNEGRLGPAVSDVAYCSVHLAMSHRSAAADQFVADYEDVTGGQLTDLRRWQLLWIANAMRWIRYWEAAYRGLGLHGLTPPVLRRRLALYAERALR
jgi:aminoglycoside phosphotransferase (APT) family kinase protein